MSGPCPTHCPKPGGAAVVVVLAVAAIAVAARPVERAADAALRVLVDVLEVAGITLGATVVAAIVTYATVLAVRARRQHGRHAIVSGRVVQAHEVAEVPVQALTDAKKAAAFPALSAPQRQAIKAPKASLADLKAAAADHGYSLVQIPGAED